MELTIMLKGYDGQVRYSNVSKKYITPVNCVFAGVIHGNGYIIFRYNEKHGDNDCLD
jgi:hypothetical protein